LPGLGEGRKAAVIAFLNIIRKAAGGQLPARQMITYTLTAYPFSVTAGIRAVTMFQVLFFLTFHNQQLPFLKSFFSIFLSSVF
jgi:hypothetical protein